MSASTGALAGSATSVGSVQSAIPPSATHRVSIVCAPAAMHNAAKSNSASVRRDLAFVVMAFPRRACEVDYRVTTRSVALSVAPAGGSTNSA